MEYKATLDLKSKIVTGFCGVLFSGISIYNVKLIDFRSDDLSQPVILLLTTVLVLSIFIFCYLYRPLKYIVDSNRVIVKRPINDLIIEFSNIKRVLLPTAESMKWTFRTFGNGGLFGYFGSFRNQTHGGMTWYATRTSNYLMIITKDNHKIVLTPDDTEMIKKIKTE